MVKMNERQLVETLAKICAYGQEHSWEQRENPYEVYDEDLDGWTADPIQKSMIQMSMEHISHICSCFIAQNTKYGGNGVESNILTNRLMGDRLNESEWQQVIKPLVEEYSKPYTNKANR